MRMIWRHVQQLRIEMQSCRSVGHNYLGTVDESWLGKDESRSFSSNSSTIILVFEYRRAVLQFHTLLVSCRNTDCDVL